MMRMGATDYSRDQKKLALRTALKGQISQLETLQDNWDGEGSLKPRTDAIRAAQFLADEVEEYAADPVPSTISLSAGRDGRILFTIFGSDEREADIWVDGTR